MRNFILMCLLSTVCARQIGNSYQLQSNGGVSTSHHTAHAYPGPQNIANQNLPSTNYLPVEQQNQQVNQQAQSSSYLPSFNTQLTSNQPAFASSQPAANSLFTPNFNHQQPAYSYGQLQEYSKAQQNQPNVAPTVTKDIFVHVAPRELEQYSAPRPLPPAPPRKHYRIVFIKAPSPPTQQALQVEAAPVEEKTIIYVLTKKPDPIDIQAIQEAMQPKQIHKPEVYFIKYKTQEEAQHAQRAIQAEYDKLGGTSQISDEGIAPVTSVIGAFDNIKQQNNLQSYGSSSSTPDQGYLPPFKL